MAQHGGARAGAGRGKINYNSYVKDYKATEARLKKKGYTMSQRMYTKKEFEAQYAAETNDRKEDIKKGKRKTLGNISRDLVAEQASDITKKQAKAVQKFYERERSEKAVAITKFKELGYTKKQIEELIPDAYNNKKISTIEQIRYDKNIKSSVDAIIEESYNRFISEEMEKGLSEEEAKYKASKRIGQELFGSP